MKKEAIEALQLFKQMHLAEPVERPKVDIESLRYPPREAQPVEAPTQEPKKQKGVNFNYPDHIVPLKQRMISALNNGARTVESIARYCKEGEKLVNLQLNRLVSRGMIGKQTNKTSGITRFYPYDLSKELGILTDPKPINRKKKVEKRSSSLYDADGVNTGNSFNTPPSVYTAEFLEKRVVEWQNEARRLANENEDLKAKLSQAQDALAQARQTRNVTSEVTEVMQEVMQLRGTVAYLESKLFGGK